MPHILALDFDETLAPTYQAIVPVWDDFMAKWLVVHGIYPSEKAARKDYTFENDYGCGPTFFAKKFGQNIAWIDAYYQASASTLLTAAKAKLKPDAELNKLLTQVAKTGATLAIITQSHRDYVMPLLPHLGLAEFFPPHLVVDRAHKRLSPNGYLQLKHLTQHLKPSSFTMVDDNAENLITAHDCGYSTVHISPQHKSPSYKQIDTHHPTLSAYLKTLL